MSASDMLLLRRRPRWRVTPWPELLVSLFFTLAEVASVHVFERAVRRVVLMGADRFTEKNY
jgi:hypothetical protein